MRRVWGMLSGCLLAAALIVVLALADAALVQEPAYSPLYEASLEQAHARLRDGDRRVPAGEASDGRSESVRKPVSDTPSSPELDEAVTGK